MTAADTAQDFVVIAFSFAPVMRKYFARQHIDVGLHPFQNVGNTIDNGIEQPRQNLLAACARHAVTPRLGRIVTKRRRLGIAQRQQPVAGKNESDGYNQRRRRVGLRHHRRRHVDRIVLQIEAARHLDLLHVFLGRHVEAELDVDIGQLFVRRLKKIEPNRLGGNCLTDGDRNRRQRTIGRHIGSNHLNVRIGIFESRPIMPTHGACDNPPLRAPLRFHEPFRS